MRPWESIAASCVHGRADPDAVRFVRAVHVPARSRLVAPVRVQRCPGPPSWRHTSYKVPLGAAAITGPVSNASAAVTSTLEGAPHDAPRSVDLLTYTLNARSAHATYRFPSWSWATEGGRGVPAFQGGRTILC